MANGNSAATVTWNGRNNAGATRAGRRLHHRASRRSTWPATPAAPVTARSWSSARCARWSPRKPLLSRRTSTGWPASTTLSFTLSRPMTVTWTLRNATGARSSPAWTTSRRPAGTVDWTFTGRPTTGRCCRAATTPRMCVPPTATLTATQAVTVDDRGVPDHAQRHDARPRPVDLGHASPPRRCRRAPRVWSTSPASPTWSVRMIKIGGRRRTR